MVEVFENEEEEDVFLCKLFGDDGRFVKFANLTGRTVRLTSRLQMENFLNMAWSTTIIIPEGGRHVWRFLGDSANVFEDFLFLLPEPYNLARQNSFEWVVEYIDSQELDTVTFDFLEGPLRLNTMKTLQPQETSEVILRRKDRAVTPLNKLAKDVIIKKVTQSCEHISCMDFPKTLEEEVISLSNDYQEIEKNKQDPCSRCKEIHQ